MAKISQLDLIRRIQALEEEDKGKASLELTPAYRRKLRSIWREAEHVNAPGWARLEEPLSRRLESRTAYLPVRAADILLLRRVLNLTTAQLEELHAREPFQSLVPWYLAVDVSQIVVEFPDEEERRRFFYREAQLWEDDERWHPRLAEALEATAKTFSDDPRWPAKAYGILLKQARRELELRQADLARRAGVKRTDISRLESGDFRFTDAWNRKLRRVLNTLAKRLWGEA